MKKGYSLLCLISVFLIKRSSVNLKKNRQINFQLKSFVFGMLFLFSGSVTAQVGSVYSGFNSFYQPRFGNGAGFNSMAEADIVHLSNDKMYIAGNFSSYNGFPSQSLIRLNSDGSVDTDFVAQFDLYDDVYAIVVQSDGKIIAGGSFDSYGGTSRNNLVRINPDGSLDNTFQIGSGCGGSSSRVTDIGLQSTGKIIVIGEFNQYGSQTRHGVVRLNLNGSLDASFGLTSGSASLDGTGFRCLAIQPNDCVLIGGDFPNYCGVGSSKLIRITANGLVDQSFNNAGIEGWESHVNSIGLAADNKILVGGYFTHYGSIVAENAVRINEDGSIDPSFNSGQSAYGSVKCIAESPNGNIILGGYFVEEIVLSLNHDGTTNPNFNLQITPNLGTSGGIESILILENNDLIILGDFNALSNTFKNRIAKITTVGLLDRDFAPCVAAMPINNGSIFKIIPQLDGKKIIFGNFTDYNNMYSPKIARILQDGSYDMSFSFPGNLTIGYVSAVAIQLDGKILVGGRMKDTTNQDEFCLIRLNPDGSIDNSFEVGVYNYERINSIFVQNDGNILVGGSFNSYNGITRYKVTRIIPSGANDPSFLNSFSSTDEEIIDIDVFSDKIYLLGEHDRVYKRHNNGAIDFSFFSEFFDGPFGLNDFLIKPDGKIVVIGSFSNYGQSASEHIAQLNENGDFDASFNAASISYDNGFSCITLQEDGKIIAGNGDSLVRFNFDGTVDLSFQIGTGFDNDPFDLLIDNNVLIAVGSFTMYNESFQNHIVAINLINTLTTSEYAFNMNSVVVFPNPTNDLVTIRTNREFVDETILLTDLQGKEVLTKEHNNGFETILDVSSLLNGVYFLSFESENHSINEPTIKIIKTNH